MLTNWQALIRFIDSSAVAYFFGQPAHPVYMI